jgi:arsenite-transporting ATPase
LTEREGARGPHRYLFFGGKGGVGKTTCAAAAALARARAGERVLAVSLDPAHSLGDALGTKLGPRPRRIAPRLEAVELDADAALDEWLFERREVLELIAGRGTYLDEEDVSRFLKLSLPGVDELVGLRELVRLAEDRSPETVVVDTAPQGHTLRLLQMPETLQRIATVLDDMQAKHRVLVGALGGAYRPDAADELVRELDHDGRRLAELLRDPERATFHWVLLPEDLAFEEAVRGVSVLEGEGFPVAELVVNRVTPPPPSRCRLCDGRRRAESAVVRRLRSGLGERIPVRFLPALEKEPRGLERLAAVGRFLSAKDRGRKLVAARAPKPSRAKTAPSERAGAGAAGVARALPRGLKLLLFGGKGGVGKTTCAAAVALAIGELEPRRRVLLLSTDPAHSLGDVLATELGDDERAVPGASRALRARELDAARVFAEKRERYRARVDELFDVLRGGSRFDAAHDRAIVQDFYDLAPPGLDELFAILTVVDLISEGADERIVVLDTAPVGHALRLLEMPEAAHAWVKTLISVLLKYRSVVGLGELGRDLVELSRGLGRLREVLADRDRARFVAVARPAELPRKETERLLDALERLGIAVEAVLWNAITPEGCARCLRTRRAERAEIETLERRARGSRAGRATLEAPAVAPPPRGAVALLEWGRTWART